MTPRQNLMAALSGGSPDWMPAAVHIANANNLPGSLPVGLLTTPLDRLAISEFVGGDLLYETGAVERHLSGGYGVKSETRGNRRQARLTTPHGSLTEEMIFADVPTPLRDSLPPGHGLPPPIANSVHSRFFVGGPPDYGLLASYHDAMSFAANATTMAGELHRVGDRGILIQGGGPSSPLYALVSGYAGIERTTYDLLDAPDAVEAAMQSMHMAACRWYETAATLPCSVIRCTEDLDTKLISPHLFRKYAVPSLKEYARICHACGKLFIVHMCGHIREFLPDLVEIGADAVHCLTQPPMGNTTLADARRVLAGHAAAMIRFDPHLLLEGDNEQLDSAVDNLVKELEGWRGAMVLIPCGRAPLASIRRVIERCHEWGKWQSTGAEPSADADNRSSAAPP